MTLRFLIYRQGMRWLLQRWTRQREQTPAVRTASQEGYSGQRKILWIHAASAGELESLWEVALRVAVDFDLVLSVFSPSGLKPLARLCDELARQGVGRVRWAGLSPLEGSWSRQFEKWSPVAWVTAKYEAWPEVWGVCSLRQTPIVILGAQSRPSLTWTRRVTRYLLGVRLPSLWLLPVTTKDAGQLRLDFSKAKIEELSDPRWKRVFVRAIQKNPQVERLAEKLRELPRPWGVLGSIWPEDLAHWSGVPVPGTLWVVPHQVDATHVDAAKAWIASQSRDCILSSQIQEEWSLEGSQKAWVLVDEMGFLAELYRHMDWAYIGGGFSDGVHSTIEPAIWGIPLACGTQRAHRFPEIFELQTTGQLTLVRSQDEIYEWIHRIQPVQEGTQKIQWKEDAERRIQKIDPGISHLHERLRMLN